MAVTVAETSVRAWSGRARESKVSKLVSANSTRRALEVGGKEVLNVQAVCKHLEPLAPAIIPLGDDGPDLFFQRG
jgi:hypothetical protein